METENGRMGVRRKGGVRVIFALLVGKVIVAVGDQGEGGKGAFPLAFKK